jgi:hypothetical protein
LALNVFHNSSQSNENSAKTYAPLEYKSDAWYAEIASIKADLAALIKGKSELKEFIASAHDCEKKNGSDFHFKYVLLKEPSLVVKETAKQNKTTMLDIPEAGVVVHFTSDCQSTNQQVQAEKSSENQTVENQDKGGEKGSLAC